MKENSDENDEEWEEEVKHVYVPVCAFVYCQNCEVYKMFTIVPMLYLITLSLKINCLFHGT